MSKGNRLRSKRNRHELLSRRTETRTAYWSKQPEKLSQELDLDRDFVEVGPPEERTRPCGGKGRCVTKNGTTASHPHVGCQK